MTAGEVDMGLLDCWEIDLPSCAGELAEALLACAELTEQTYPTQSRPRSAGPRSGRRS
jgi:hypothetical protein